MSAELFLCLSQEEINTPYQFKMTGINVYAMEEAVYHCYHYWKQSYDEFTCPEFLEWVRMALNLPFLASKIMVIDKVRSAKDKLIAFLDLFDYFDEIQLASLKVQLAEWEKRLEWERLKERGDYLVQKGEPQKAVQFYKKALAMQENALLLNNLGVAFMSLSLFQEALVCFDKALAQTPDELQMLLNMAEASVFNHNFEKALRALNAAEVLDKDNPDIQYLYGELNFEAGNIRYSIDYFERAIAMKPEQHYIFRLTDVYVKLRQYDKAMENLARVQTKNKAYLMKLASLHHDANNIPAAIKTIERALISTRGDAALWTKLAMYHRLDYDLNRANGAILTALSIDKNNDETLLEMARIKKAMGKTKEYQAVLHSILCGFKTKYRESIVL